MQSTQTLDRSASRGETVPPTRHIYPPGTAMLPGAVAYCGWVKQTPWSGATWRGEVTPDRCVVCLELAERDA